jgi:response regulator of citrate/malate metabolism
MGRPTKEEKAATLARVKRLALSDSTLTATQIGERLGMSHVTARKYLREAGVYVLKVGGPK